MGDGFLIFGFQECPDNCPRSEFGLGFGIKWVGGGGDNFETKLSKTSFLSRIH